MPLPTGAGPHHVALLLRRAGGDTRSALLETTYWKLRTLHGGGTVTPVEPTREAWLTLDPAHHRASGFASCNQFTKLTGDYTLEGERLMFSHIATTPRLCLHAME